MTDHWFPRLKNRGPIESVTADEFRVLCQPGVAWFPRLKNRGPIESYSDGPCTA